MFHGPSLIYYQQSVIQRMISYALRQKDIP
ncbi:hypothetical protein PATA110616_11660 [Paenibacillus tarimensis]